jgi:hypothetical protein
LRRSGAPTAMALPHRPQKRKPSGFSVPQLGHTGMGRL